MGALIILTILADTHRGETFHLEITLVTSTAIPVRTIIQNDFLIRNVNRSHFFDIPGELTGVRILSIPALREHANLMVFMQKRSAGSRVPNHVVAQHRVDRPFLLARKFREMP